MQAASRESLAMAKARLGEQLEQAPADQLRTLSDELFQVVGLLARERVLRRHLSDPATAEQTRDRLVDTMLSGRVAQLTLDTVRGLVRSRWSQGSDLTTAVETLARQTTLAQAERDGVIEEVEDELFRFGRMLDAQPRLRDLLGDEAKPVDGRAQLLDGLIADRVQPVTRQLLTQAVRVPRGRLLDAVVAELAEAAAAQRNRSVAKVTTAVALSDEQERRLVQALTNVYRRPVSVQVEVDPDLLGGLVIRVGDEVIDGSVATKLAAARQDLSG